MANARRSLTATLVPFAVVLLTFTETSYQFKSVATYTYVRDKFPNFYIKSSPWFPYVASYNGTRMSVVYCASLCEEAQDCFGFNFCDVSGTWSCDLNPSNLKPLDTARIWFRVGCQYFHQLVSMLFTTFVFNPQNTK